MSFTCEVAEKFQKALDEYNMFGEHDTHDGHDTFGEHNATGNSNIIGKSRGVLVGYSGGADSSALLMLLRNYCTERGIYLKALHVHHGIRGAEADRDAEHCRMTCEKLGIVLEVVYADIPKLARESGRGVEETARDFRYSEFARIISKDERLDRVATAHNADDNAETVLFNLIRGTGTDGIAGIPPVRSFNGGLVIRPLIYCSKAEILGYCRENGIEYIFDSTNSDTTYSRNYIRGELLPKFARLNPAYLSSITRLSSSARSDAAFLDSAADDFLAANLSDGGLSIQALACAADAVASRALRRFFAGVSDSTLEHVHTDALIKLVRKAVDGSSLSLPGSVTARISGGRLYFGIGTGEAPPDFNLQLKPGVNRCENPDFAVLLLPDASHSADFEKYNECLKNIYKLSIHAIVKSDKINHILFVRPKRDGDAYVYGKMTRKLKKLFNDRGIDLRRRRELPVVCDNEGIIWVPGFGIADRALPSDGDIAELYYYYN